MKVQQLSASTLNSASRLLPAGNVITLPIAKPRRRATSTLHGTRRQDVLPAKKGRVVLGRELPWVWPARPSLRASDWDLSVPKRTQAHPPHGARRCLSRSARRRTTSSPPAAKVSQGGDPSAERKEKQAAASMLRTCEAYLRHAQARQRQRSFVETERHLRKHAAPLHHERAEALRRGDIAALASSEKFGRCVTCVLQPLPPVVAMVVQLNCEGAGGTGGERREAVLAQTFSGLC